LTYIVVVSQAPEINGFEVDGREANAMRREGRVCAIASGSP
jgi:hypothetical protein